MLGAGVRAPFVLHGLAERQHDLGLTEVVLHDTDHDRLDVMTALSAFLCRSWGATFTLRGEHDARAALGGAGVVFAAIRPGQERARTLDEQLALYHGVLGQETTGPGGFAMAMRTIPAMLEHARTVEEVAPTALVINVTNRVGIVTQALHDHTSVRAVGVCDGPVSMQRSIAAFLGVPEGRVYADYAGLNHCGWIHRVLVDGVDRLPELIDRFEELRAFDRHWGLFDAELIRTVGMLPMEDLYFFYDRGRAGDLAAAAHAWTRAMETRSDTYFARERGEDVPGAPTDDEAPAIFREDGYEGVAAAVMLTAVRREHAPMVLDVPNRGAIR